MQFIDKAKIYIEAGKGGDGTVAFRREAHVPKGGPAGGDGGKGGSIIFEATTSLSTLLDLKYKRVYKARPGGKDVEKIAAGDELDVNMAAGEIKIVNKGITIQTKPLPEFIQKIADCGGLINYVKGEHQE